MKPGGRLRGVFGCEEVGLPFWCLSLSIFHRSSALLGFNTSGAGTASHGQG